MVRDLLANHSGAPGVLIGMVQTHFPQQALATRGVGRPPGIMQLPPQNHRTRHSSTLTRPHGRAPHGAGLIRKIDEVEVPAAGLWNIPSGWARIELTVPRIFRPALRARMRLKQGMLALADDPTHSTAHFSLDAGSLCTGDADVDSYLYDDVLQIARYSTIPVHIGTVEHVGGPHWTAYGWITIRGTATPIELDIAYEGVHRPGLAARFRALATLPLRDLLPVNNGLRGRFLAGRNVHISIEVHAEPVRASAASVGH